jgi:DNA-binding NarL/FixJ family response regulator
MGGVTAAVARPCHAPLQVVVVEDQLMFLQLLVGMLRSLAGLEVVATATTAAAGIRICQELRPDLLILDLGLPDQDGITVAEALAAVKSEARVIVLSGGASSFICDAALDPMLHAVVDKVDACETLVVEIAELIGAPPQRTPPLSQREEQVLALIGQGLPNRRIAERLGLSVNTVDTHRRNISLKLGVKGGELVRQATLRNLQGPQASL